MIEVFKILDDDRKPERAAVQNRYVTHTNRMRHSPAWRGLPHNARRVLDRLELQHMREAGCQNGKLVATYDDLVDAGIRRSSCRLAVEQAVALGFLKITRRGYAVKGVAKVPSTYGLTYVLSQGKSPAQPTNEWERFTTAQQVRDALKAVLKALEAEQAIRRARKAAKVSGEQLVDRASPGREARL
jgi:hypothetical protein